MSSEIDFLSDAKVIKAAPVGRPRLLNREGILEAAIVVGLEELTMKRLATYLNVGTATLYQYFDNRGELLQAAAVHALSGVPLPEDHGQHWSVYAREYALSIQALLAENPYYIMNYQKTVYGFEVQFRLAEKFLAVMESRGLALTESMNLFNAIAMAAVGGAIEMTRDKAFEECGGSMAAAVAEALEKVDKKDIPLFYQVAESYVEPAQNKIDLLLKPLFEVVARRVGEKIDLSKI